MPKVEIGEFRKESISKLVEDIKDRIYDEAEKRHLTFAEVIGSLEMVKQFFLNEVED